MTRVVFQGEKGAYSEEAIYQGFGREVETVPSRSLEGIFEAVEAGKGDENSPVSAASDDQIGPVADGKKRDPVHAEKGYRFRCFRYVFREDKGVDPSPDADRGMAIRRFVKANFPGHSFP